MAKFFAVANTDARPGCASYTGINFTNFSPFTICCWFRSTQNSGAAVMGGKWGTFPHYLIAFQSARVGLYVSDAGAVKGALTSSTYNTGVWTHAAGVFDGSATKIKINAGVTEDVTGTTVVTGLNNSGEAFTVGDYNVGGGRYDGDFAHWCIFSRALSNNEIKTVMMRGPMGVQGLELWLPMISGAVIDTNLAPNTNKTALSGVTTSFSLSGSGPPTGLITGVDFTDPSLAGTPATPLTQGVSDNLNFPWADAAARAVQSVTPLLVTVVDKILRSGSINGNNLALRDGLSWTMGPSGPVNIAVSDLGAFLDDSNLLMGYGLAVAD